MSLYIARNESMIDQVCRMPSNQFVVNEAEKHGLSVLNVMWEDTARTPGSCWGANITDMTLQVRHPENREKTSLLPVLRQPNFRDITCDIPLENFRLKVGNQTGDKLAVISLTEYLEKLGSFVSDPSTYNADNEPSLITKNDSHVLVSAQACVLPIEAGGSGKIEFNPVLMNYQSREDSPAVLTILLTPDGASATVLDNHNDRAEWGQNVYHNNNGQKTCLTGQRLSAYTREQASEIAAQQGISAEEALQQVEVADDINMVIILQVPLKHKERSYEYGGLEAFSLSSFNDGISEGFLCAKAAAFEDAVISHGEDEGKHFELGGYKLERDIRFPIRATVQFYKVSDTADIGSEHIQQMAECIQRVYKDASYVGSLVDGTLQVGELGMGEARPTQPAPLHKPVLGPPVDLSQVTISFELDKNPKAYDLPNPSDIVVGM
jgi:hypothetical protein